MTKQKKEAKLRKLFSTILVCMVSVTNNIDKILWEK